MSKPVFLLVLPLVVASLATAREHHGNWIEVRSSHVTIVTSNEKQGRRIAVQFERMWAIFQQTYPKPEDNPGSPPLFVLAFRNKDQFRALEPGPYQSKKSLPLHGMFVRAADKNYILMRLDSQAGNPYPLVDHEYTHLFLSEEDGKLPLWLNEGLAQFYQSIEIHDREILLGEPNEQHLMLLRQEKLLPLATLFAVDNKSTYYLEKKKGSIFYAQCWALTHYLMLQDYAEKTSKIAQYRMLVDDNVDPVAAAIQVFGDLRKLQRTLELYIAQRSFNHFETKLLNKLDDSQLEVKSITRAQADALQADFLAASERVEEARAFLSSLPTDDASVQANLASLQPARSSQPEDKPVNDVQTDVPCPLTQILSGASERAAEMVENLQRFTATEQVEHTEFRRSGRPRSASNQWFNYTAEIDQGSSGSFWVEEYRSAKTQGDAPPISDTGTAAFALIFHPQKIGNFEFHCEGRADVQGTEAWQLRFEESPDPGRSFHQIRISRSVYQLRFKGRAWIAANGYQILRLLTDLVAPIPQIQLQLEHLDIVYAPVTFDKQQFTMWLPESASMQIGYRGRHYQRVHKFTHFQLFLVVTKQTVKEPSLGPGA